MRIVDILREWHINIRDEDYFLDKLYELYPENCYVIDRYPYIVRDNEKYKQVEIFYDGIAQNQNTFAAYKNEEEKLKQIMRKLWLYDIVEVETNLNAKKIANVKKAIEIENHDVLDTVRTKSNGSWVIERVEELDLLVELGARERVCTSFIFRNFKMIITTNALDMFIFLADIQSKELMEKIVNIEGLYLRA